jgi:hypothetical protein
MGTPRKNGIDHGKARSDVGPDSDGVDLWIPLLDPGVHDQIFAELKPLLCFNQRRKRMWAKLATFLLLPASSDSFEYAYLGGGFLSRKPEPEDIDVVLQTLLPYGPEAFEAISTFFVTGLAEIREVYGVHLHFWMENAPAGLVDFRAFFQYSRSKKDSMHLDPSKGVARINLRNGKNLENIRLISESEN